MVGQALKEIMPNATYVSSTQYDLRNHIDVNYLLLEIRPDAIIHLAAKVGGVKANFNNLGSFYYDNIMMNTNILEAARRFKVKKLVSCLTTCIFPDQIDYPLTEDKIHLGPPHKSNYGYAYAKRMLDVQTEVYRKQYGVNFISVIPTNIYGPHDNFNLEAAHVIPSLIHKCYLATQNNADLEIWGDGLACREFIYAADIAQLIKWALKNYNEESPIIFSASNEITIKDLVGLIVKEFGFKGKIVFNAAKPSGQHRKPSDNSKLVYYLPDFEFTPIDVGIKKTVEWFVKNYKNLRK